MDASKNSTKAKGPRKKLSLKTDNPFHKNVARPTVPPPAPPTATPTVEATANEATPTSEATPPTPPSTSPPPLTPTDQNGNKKKKKRKSSEGKEPKRNSSKFYVPLTDETPAGEPKMAAKASEVIPAAGVRKTRLLFEGQDYSAAATMTKTEAKSPPSSVSSSPSFKKKGMEKQGSMDTDPGSSPTAPIRKKRKPQQDLIRKRIQTMDCVPQSELSGPDFSDSSLDTDTDSNHSKAYYGDDSSLGGNTPCHKKTDTGKTAAVDFLKQELQIAMAKPKASPDLPRRRILPKVPVGINDSQDALKPKPSILRPKPNLQNIIKRTDISSFTTEDFDICQRGSVSPNLRRGEGRVSRFDEARSREARGAKRRSKSVGASSRVQTLIGRLTMKPDVAVKPLAVRRQLPATPTAPCKASPELPKKPVIKPKSEEASAEDAKGDTLKKESDDTATKPATTVPQAEDKDTSEAQESSKDSAPSPMYSTVNKSNSLDSGLNLIEGETILVESSLYGADDNANVITKANFEQAATNSEVKVKIIEARHRVDAQYEDVETKDKIADLPSFNKNLEVPKPARKLPRKKSSLSRARKGDKQSFRHKVYQDVALKDEIPEDAEVEDLEFSVSDEDYDDFSDSFTDEEDMEFEQSEAARLGMSPSSLDTDKTSSEESTSQDGEQLPSVPKDKLHNVAYELLTTERTYVEKLNLLDQEFQNGLIQENRAHRFMPDDLIPQIFMNIKSIHQFHDFLLAQLEDRMKHWEDCQKIGDIMMRWAPFLKLYTEYSNKFDNATSTINACLKNYPKFASVVEEIQKKPECGMLTLQHHMLSPIQRVPRYKLLLEQYIKYLPEDSPDKEDAEKALNLVATAATHSNETIQKNERSLKLLGLRERLIGGSSLDLISPTRDLIREGSITKISARDGSHLDRYLFLFTDCLLVCVPVNLLKLGKHQYKVKTKLDIEGMRVMEGDDLFTPNTFQVKSKTKSIEFHTSTPEEKDDWQASLWSTIAEFTKKQMSRMTGATLTENPSEFQENELGKRAPTWIKDQAASMCMVCAKMFTTFFRRHHCRACGRVVCGKCSARQTHLPYDNHKLNRVCDFCYNTLELKLMPQDIKEMGMQKKNKGLHNVKATDPSLVRGYLQMSQNKKTWDRRYFAIRDDFVLYSFKAHEDLFAITSLPMPGYIVGRVKDDSAGHRFKLFHIGLKKEYYFMADDQKALDKWMAVLEKVIRAELPDDMDPSSPAPETKDEAPLSQS